MAGRVPGSRWPPTPAASLLALAGSVALCATVVLLLSPTTAVPLALLAPELGRDGGMVAAGTMRLRLAPHAVNMSDQYSCESPCHNDAPNRFRAHRPSLLLLTAGRHRPDVRRASRSALGHTVCGHRRDSCPGPSHAAAWLRRSPRSSGRGRSLRELPLRDGRGGAVPRRTAPGLSVRLGEGVGRPRAASRGRLSDRLRDFDAISGRAGSPVSPPPVTTNSSTNPTLSINPHLTAPQVHYAAPLPDLSDASGFELGLAVESPLPTRPAGVLLATAVRKLVIPARRPNFPVVVRSRPPQFSR